MHSLNLHGESLRGRIRGFLYYTPRSAGGPRHSSHFARYQAWVLLGLAIPTILGGLISGSWWGARTGFLWGGPVRMFVVASRFGAQLGTAQHRVAAVQFARQQSKQLAPRFGDLGRR